MSRILERAQAVSAVLRGDFSTCGKKIGHVMPLKALYDAYVGWQGYERDGKEESDDDKLYADLREAAGRGDSELCNVVTSKIARDDATVSESWIQVPGTDEMVLPNDTHAFETSVMPKGTPSAFGDILNQETRVDGNVRVATEFTDFEWRLPQRHELSIATVKPQCIPEVVDAVKKLLKRCALESFELKKYKLNLYGEGGFFKEHIDHPIDAANTVGTLVIVFPTEFEGGELFVGSESIGCDTENFGVCAFFCTTPHEVRPVTKGCRVTVTYAINRYESPPSQPLSPVAPLTPSNVDTLMVQRLKRAAGSRSELGILLTSKYTLEAIEQHGASCITGAHDRALYDYLVDTLHLTVDMITVACDFQATLYDGESDESDCYEADIYQLSLRRWERLFQLDVEGENDDDSSSDFLKHSDITFLCDTKDSGGKKVMNDYRAPIPFAGNESEPGELHCIHFHAALIVSFPNQRKRERESAKEEEAKSNKRLCT